MGHQGVMCFSCHNPHSGKLVATWEDNQLCLNCHKPPGANGAPPIDELKHGGHKPGSVGNRCVECHMTHKTYMVRDPRRDHGFTSPDPLLTKELGIPNACSKCHADQTIEWNIDWCDRWYGEKMERRARHRARAIAHASTGTEAAITNLLGMAASEEIAAWRTALVSLLEPHAERADVGAFLADELKHTNAMVRAAAVRSLAPRPGAYQQLLPLRRDPSRLVRLDAAWNTLHAIEREPVSYAELVRYLDFTCDQPSGALRQSQRALREERPAEAEKWARRFVAWDSGPSSQYLFGRIMNALGRNDEALTAFREAARLDARNADYPYTLALLAGEMGSAAEVVANLRRAVQIDPNFGRAWYNLGLAYAQENRLDDAAAALGKAEALLRGSPDAAYALATIHLRAGRKAEAVAAAQRALAVAPGHREAKALIEEAGR
jgi:predicted CXXCH cytochrome family protein